MGRGQALSLWFGAGLHMQQPACAGFDAAKLRNPLCGDFVECSQFKWALAIHSRQVP